MIESFRFRGFQIMLSLDRERDFFQFSIISVQALKPTQPPVQWVPECFSGDKAAGE